MQSDHLVVQPEKASSGAPVEAPIYRVEQATVYRAGGRRWLTRGAAIKAYAAAKFRAKHRCECEQGDYSSGYPGYTCGVHDLRERVLPRYVRLLKRRDVATGSATSKSRTTIAKKRFISWTL